MKLERKVELERTVHSVRWQRDWDGYGSQKMEVLKAFLVFFRR